MNDNGTPFQPGFWRCTMRSATCAKKHRACGATRGNGQMIQNSCIPIQNILRGFSINGSVIRFKQHAPTSSTPVGVVKSLDVDSIPNEARISISRAVLCHGFKRKNKEKMIRPPILNASSSHPRPLPIPHPMTHSPVRATLDICVSIVSSESLALDVLHQRLHLVVVQLLQPLGDDRLDADRFCARHDQSRNFAFLVRNDGDFGNIA